MRSILGDGDEAREGRETVRERVTYQERQGRGTQRVLEADTESGTGRDTYTDRFTHLLLVI